MASKQEKQKDVIATARVPIGKHARGAKVLEKIGATQTQLINAAYDFLIENGRLPESAQEHAQDKGVRILSMDQAAKIKNRRARTTFSVPDSYWQGKTDKELSREARRKRYESLA